MAEKVIALGTANIRQLARDFKALAARFREEDDQHVGRIIEQEAGEVIAERVRYNIASIQDVDGNYLGSDNPNASVMVEKAQTGHEVVWRGKQIVYLEFGTGAKGAAGGYPGSAMGASGYSPDPTKEVWAYQDARKTAPAGRRPRRSLGSSGRGTWVFSYGLAPQAPMYNVSLRFARIVLKRTAQDVVKEAVESAITV